VPSAVGALRALLPGPVPAVAVYGCPGHGSLSSQDQWALPDAVPRRLRRALGHLYVVADGMGGLAAGSQASAMVVSTLLEAFYDDARRERDLALESAIVLANAALLRQAERLVEEAPQGLGSTVVAAVLRAGDALVAHVGDSRAYHFTPDGVHRRTADHTLAAELQRRGTLSAEEAARHPGRRQVTRALGRAAGVDVELVRWRVNAGDRLLLLTDGAYESLDDDELWRLVRRRRVEAAARNIEELLARRQPEDDATVLIADPFGPRRG